MIARFVRACGYCCCAPLFAFLFLALPADSLLIDPATQGIFHFTNTGVTLEIGYATVTDTTRLTVTQEANAFVISATAADGRPLDRFEMPLIATLPDGLSVVVGWPGPIRLPDASMRWLVVFDANGIYALPSASPAPDEILYLGPLEHYTPDLIEHNLTWDGTRFAASDPSKRAILRTDPQHQLTLLPTAAHAARYADRFAPEDLRNPGGFMLLGWTSDLVSVVRALRATIPDDPDLPLPGATDPPLDLILPFDCSADWVVSWGYHHSTPQNRFAVDFAAANSAPGQPVYAAHVGTVYLKRYGTADQYIDVGLSARVLSDDGFTSTVYGHLDPAGTFARWNVDESALPDFEWIEVGQVAPGQVIGVMGHTGYATGPHIHFAIWSWDQSLYQPLDLVPNPERGFRFPAAQRRACDIYRR